MIEVKNLVKLYGNKRAVDDVSFVVNKGEILGFLGPNGAGKSTTMNIITGYLSSNEGTVTIDGDEIFQNPIKTKAKIGYLPEQPPLYMDMTVKAYLEFLFDLKKVKLPKKQHLEEVCELVKISDVYTRVIKNLSKGYKQRVGLAGALLGNPPVLILDEPTVGLDPKQIIEIRNLIRSLGEKYTVILSSHILPEVQATCDRVIVISHGKIVADDTPDNLTKTLSNEHKLVVRIEGKENDIYSALRGVHGMLNVTKLGEKETDVFEFIVESQPDMDVRRSMFYAMAKGNYPILGLKSLDLTLEDVFLQLTGDNPISMLKEDVDYTAEDMDREEIDGIIDEAESVLVDITQAQTDDIIEETEEETEEKKEGEN